MIIEYITPSVWIVEKDNTYGKGYWVKSSIGALHCFSFKTKDEARKWYFKGSGVYGNEI